MAPGRCPAAYSAYGRTSMSTPDPDRRGRRCRASGLARCRGRGLPVVARHRVHAAPSRAGASWPRAGPTWGRGTSSRACGAGRPVRGSSHTPRSCPAERGSGGRAERDPPDPRPAVMRHVANLVRRPARSAPQPRVRPRWRPPWLSGRWMMMSIWWWSVREYIVQRHAEWRERCHLAGVTTRTPKASAASVDRRS